MWHVVFTRQAAKDAKNLKAAGLDKKAKELVEVVRNDPFGRPPSYEGLVGNLSDLYSRRISIWRRFVYEVIREPVSVGDARYEGTVKVLRMWSRYDRLN